MMLRHFVILGAVVGLLGCGTIASGQVNWTGSGASNVWSDAGNWDAPLVDGSALNFAGTSFPTNVNDAPASMTNVNAVSFANGGFDIQGGALTLNAGISSVGSNLWEIASTLSGSQSFSVPTAGDTLTLSGPLNTNGQALTVTGAGNVTLSGSLSGSGPITPDNNWSGTLTLGGANNSGFSGGIMTNSSAPGGTIAVSNSNSLGTAPLQFGNVNGFATRQFLNVGTGTTPYTIPNTLIIDGFVDITGSQPVTLTGNFEVAPSATTDTHISVSNTATTTLAGNWIASVANPGGLLSINGGSASSPVNIVLSGYDATFNGGTRFGFDFPLFGSLTFAGTMDKQLYYLIGSQANPPISSFTVNVASDTAFVTDPSTPAGNAALAQVLNSELGVTWVAQGGPRLINQMLYSRWPVFSGSNALTFSSSTGQYTAGPMGYSGVAASLINGQTSNTWTFNGGRVTFVTGVSTAAAGIPFTVAGTTGTMVVGGTGNFQSTVDVASAALIMDGNMNVGTGPVTVEGTLGGTGTINSSVSVNNGILSPGDLGLGILSVIGNVGFSGGALDISGTGSALTSLSDSGNFVLSGTETLNVAGSLSPGTYTLVRYTGTETGSFGMVNIPAGDSINYGTGSNSAITLTAAAVPEPASVALLIAGLVAGFGFWRRKK